MIKQRDRITDRIEGALPLYFCAIDAFVELPVGHGHTELAADSALYNNK